jgi:parallel beta-helix repeat protein
VVLSATVYTVNSTGSGATGTGTSGTLPYVISRADIDTNPDGSTIEFDPTVFSSSQTIPLTATLKLSETTGPMVIEGPGADLLTISGGKAATVFTVESGVTASLSGLTISDGSTAGSGGGLSNAGTATLTDCTISGNSAKYGGGAYDSGGAKLTLTDCTISGNSATDGGGLDNKGTVTLTDCTIDGNKATGKGAGLDEIGTADVTLTDCTISGNSTQSDGGGMYAGDTVKLALINCTISGNYAQSYGGGASVGGTAKLTLTDCTVSGNYAGTYSGGTYYNGGGLYEKGGTAALTNTIVAGNSGSGSGEDDISGKADSAVTGDFNLIGPGGSGGIVGGSNGNIVLDGSTDPGLAPLGEYGGSTQTIALLPGSPALGAGTAVASVTTDQRGEPLASAPDIGAFQSQGFSITRTGDGTPQQTTDGTAFPNPLSVVVTAKNHAEPVAGGIVTFSAPSSGASAGFSTQGATIDAGGSASTFAADNSIPGSYVVTATVAGVAPVSFSLTNLVSTPILNYTVNSASGGLTGSGSSGTLPYVVFLANANADTSTDGNTIQFDPSVFSTPQTITLDATLVLSETSGPEVIDGPGAGLLTVSGGKAVSVFQVDGGVTARVSGLTISGGSTTGSGGGLYNAGTATLTGCTITGNQGQSGGGAYNSNTGKLTLTDCTLSGNSAYYGGGLDNDGTAMLTDCTISGNSVTQGGGLEDDSGTATLTDCTLSGNSASKNGGGAIVETTAALTLMNCTISGNSATKGGGLYQDGGTASLTNTIIAANTGTAGAPDDIGGSKASGVSGTYDLIGTGGSGGIAGGSNGNIVLASLSGLGLGALANNGGPTQTLALMTGSPAIHAGTVVNGVTTDQRGKPLDDPPDIGAYQAQLQVPLVISSITAVAPAERNTPVTRVTLTLSEPAASNGFGINALTLTDNGGPNLITSGVSITAVSGATYQISGLSSLTAGEGMYSLTVNAAKVVDFVGNAGTGSRSTSWLMDTTPPTSTVKPLPATTTSTTVALSVTGNDPDGAHGGPPSGVASYAIFESEDGKPFTMLTTITAPAQKTNFTGQAGHAYSFYSVATDKAGNVQPTPATAQATTRILIPLTVTSIADVSPNPRNTPVTSITVTLNETPGPSGFTDAALVLTDDGGPNLITPAVTITLVTGETYVINGLNALTAAESEYTLTLKGTDLFDQFGDAGTGSQSVSWLMDTTPPTSTVAPLPSSTTSTSFPVSVAGTDPPGAGGSPASGVTSFTIYVSSDQGPFTVWTTVTSANPTAQFSGQTGHTYEFYSVATDAAGNVQPPSAAAQATISVPTPSTPAMVRSAQPDFQRKLNKKGKPVGKAVLSGFTFVFDTPLDPATATSAANYRVATFPAKAKKKGAQAPRPITNFTVSYNAGSDAVTINLVTTQTFTSGGQITILSGVTSASGGALRGTSVFTIGKGGRSIAPS